MRKLIFIAPLVAVQALSIAAFSANDLLDKARQAAGGVERFRRFRSLEVRGVVGEPGGAATGAIAFRIQIPDKFAVAEDLHGNPYVASVDGAAYWAKSGETELRPNEDAKRRVKNRANRFLASYLLHVDSSCQVASDAVASAVAVTGSCGSFRLEFDPSSSRLSALSFAVIVLKGGSPEELRKVPGNDLGEKLMNRASSEGSVRTTYSDFRLVDGWRLPFQAVTVDPFATTTFTIRSVKFNLPLTAADFEKGPSVMELQQWVASAVR
jgi:hypothetical protein